MDSIYNKDRLERISKILPTFSKIAKAGDVVYMGLEGDPAFPFSKGKRPTATIQNVSTSNEGTNVELKMANGKIETVNEYTIHPHKVWEFDNKSFQNVLKREEAKQQISTSRSESKIGQSDVDFLKGEIETLRRELAFEKNYTRDFHNTYIKTLRELTTDVLRLDKEGKAEFSKTFRSEFDLMKSRSEESAYRGVEEDGMSSASEDCTDFF